MAKIYTETITLKFSRLVRDTDQTESIFTQELLTDVEGAVAALAGDGVVVEIDDIKTNEE